MFIKLLRTYQIIISYDFSYVAALLPLRCNRGSLFYCCKMVSFYHRVLLLVLQNKSLCLSICVCVLPAWLPCVAAAMTLRIFEDLV